MIRTILSTALNVSILASFVFIGINHATEAKAEQKLSVVSDEDRICLAKNIFFEGRNQSTLGQVSIGWVTLNRMESDRFPDTICGVVKQGRKDDAGNMIRHKCQFSWYCDGKSDIIPDNVVEQRAWEDAQLIADVVLFDWAREKASPVKGATFYHADYVSPYWAPEFTKVVQIDTHIFYE